MDRPGHYSRIMQPDTDPRPANWDSARITPAIVLISIGVLFLLSNLHLIPGMNWFDFWPVILIVLGAARLADTNRRGDYTGGLILFGLGALFLASNMGAIPFPVWDLWPLILIWIGISLLFQRSRWPVLNRLHDWHRWDAYSTSNATAAGDLNLTAIFSGGKRRIVSDDFRGGVISAVFGGFELDLRRCSMKADSAVIKIDAVFGAWK